MSSATITPRTSSAWSPPGEIQKYPIDRPSHPFHIGSVVLGLVLIGIGLELLLLVRVGLVTG